MKRILVIEDNDNNLYLILFILEKNGFEVFDARDGLSGMELALKDTFDLIIMDTQLPDINGLKTTRRIRAAGTRNDVPIIAITSYAMPGDRESALAAGCNGYIEKPINPETIIPDISKFLKT